MVTLLIPSGAVTVRVPVVVSVVSPIVVKPFSNTVAWPVAPALPSTGTIAGAPSVTPLMMMVSCAVSVAVSGSLRV